MLITWFCCVLQLKLRSQIALKQEEVLKEKEKQTDKQEAEIKDLKDQVATDTRKVSPSTQVVSDSYN